MKLDFTTDAILKGPTWANSIDHLVGPLFSTNWDLYALCISIGMMFDEQVDDEEMVPENYDLEPRYVPRNVLRHSEHEALLEFMLKSALVTTKHVDLNEDERLELAFEDDVKPDFNPITFLTKFANGGVIRVNQLVSDVDITETMESLMIFLKDAYEKGVENIEETEELDQ